MTDKQENNNKDEAEVLIEFAGETYKNQKLVLSVLDSIMTSTYKKFSREEWGMAKFIAAKTLYISVEEDYDVDVEKGDWGLPVIVGAGGSPIGVDILDEENLKFLREEVDNILNKTEGRVSDFVSMTNRPKWNCLKCNRFLGVELSSIEEVKKLLRDFSMKKYRKCRSCKALNYFNFDSESIEFKTALD